MAYRHRSSLLGAAVGCVSFCSRRCQEHRWTFRGLTFQTFVKTASEYLTCERWRRTNKKMPSRRSLGVGPTMLRSVCQSGSAPALVKIKASQPLTERSTDSTSARSSDRKFHEVNSEVTSLYETPLGVMWPDGIDYWSKLRADQLENIKPFSSLWSSKVRRQNVQDCIFL